MRPSLASQTSRPSNGKQIFALVDMVSFEGKSELSLLNESGDIEIGNSGSSSEITMAGAHDEGLALSPSENSLEVRCLATTSRASGLPPIVLLMRNFA